METPNKIVIYTDGSSRGNPGPGGFGAILMFGQLRKEISQGFRKTTNNRMELLAVIIALESLKTNALPVFIFTDSKYVVDSVSKKWLDKWIKTNFAGGKKNKDLWLRYAKIAANFQIQFNWVKGHADNPLNNRCDLLATTAADGKDLLIDLEFERNY
ncbi:ribonuclease HI [Rhizosphaericola mali]|uniref:ribonuclease H n=1 Tax=Rhizosphaericola mali TaxID=2545455 RepID=A0A5P2G5P7_9BACT|nr:ribonuclease HI [Rhizosphaericola mali]